jgi:hypothetical protein
MGEIIFTTFQTGLLKSLNIKWAKNASLTVIEAPTP